MNEATRSRLARRAHTLAVEQGISEQEARRELSRRAGRKSAARRREKQLLTQPNLPAVN